MSSKLSPSRLNQVQVTVISAVFALAVPIAGIAVFSPSNASAVNQTSSTVTVTPSIDSVHAKSLDQSCPNRQTATQAVFVITQVDDNTAPDYIYVVTSDGVTHKVDLTVVNGHEAKYILDLSAGETVTDAFVSASMLPSDWESKNGQFNLSHYECSNATPSPSATPTPSSSATPTPTPSATPTPTPSATPTPTPSATPTPTPSATPTPTPSATPTPSVSPSPTPEIGGQGSVLGDMTSNNVGQVLSASTSTLPDTGANDGLMYVVAGLASALGFEITRRRQAKA